jgi:uncharacterized Zn finger protein
MSYYFARQPYVSVAEKSRRAERQLARLKKRGQAIAPVRIEGRAIAKSFWGQSWCKNLERYSDYDNRLPRGRTYVRNGSVVDLQITKGEVTAMVAGSDLYNIKVAIAPIKTARWKSICRHCAGTVDSLIELLQGRLAKSVMDRVCREGDGLFPSPSEIKLSCSCPDWADMCKHVAAVLYGVGARLDESPQLLFVLRDVDESELLGNAEQGLGLARAAPSASKILDESDFATVFGLEMAETTDSSAPTILKRPQRPKAPSKRLVRKTKLAAKNDNTHRATPVSSARKMPPRVGGRKRRPQRQSQDSA